MNTRVVLTLAALLCLALLALPGSIDGPPYVESPRRVDASALSTVTPSPEPGAKRTEVARATQPLVSLRQGGHSIGGRVLDSADEPIAGATISVFVADETGDPTSRSDLAAVRTGSLGEFEIELGELTEAISPLRARDLHVFVRASKAGYLSDSAVTEWSSAISQDEEVELLLFDGPALHGFAVDQLGRPLPDATVLWIRPDFDTESTDVASDGRFEIDPLGDEITGTLIAVDPVFGRSRPTAASTEIRELVVDRPFEAVHGTAHFRSGVPVAQLELTLSVVEWDHGDLEDWQVGSPTATVRTSADGSFAVRGLAKSADGYELSTAFDLDAAPRVVQAGDAPIRIVVDKSCVRVRILDETGTPLSGAKMRIRTWRGRDAKKAERTWRSGGVFSSAVVRSAESIPVSRPPWRTAWVEPGGFALVEVEFRGASKEQAAFYVPNRAEHIDRSIFLRTETETQGVDLDLVTPPGVELGDSRFRIVTSFGDRVELDLPRRDGFYALPPNRRLHLARGRYRMSVWPEATAVDRPLMPFRITCDVRAREFTTARRELVLGARVALEVGRLLHTSLPSPLSGQCGNPAFRFDVHLVLDGCALQLHLRSTSHPSWNPRSGLHECPERLSLVGQEVVEPGPATLRVTCSLFDPATTSLTLSEGLNLVDLLVDPHGRILDLSAR